MTIQELYAAMDGSYESVKRILPMDKMIEKFLPRLLDDKSFGKLKHARENNNDPKELFEAAHAMKGVLANLGLDNLSKMASVVAEEFRQGKSRTMDDDALNSHLDALEKKFESTLEHIRNYVASKG